MKIYELKIKSKYPYFKKYFYIINISYTGSCWDFTNINHQNDVKETLSVYLENIPVSQKKKENTLMS